jgi:16S rRNA (guanine527-N7)-methyltransferase
VLPPLRRHLGVRAARILDVGSGGGLPGVVLAAAEPAWDVTCIDAVGKKAAFVRQAAGELELLNLHVAHARVETLRSPPFDVITARAFAALPEFVRLTRPLLAPGGVWMAMKGKRPDDEIAALPADVEPFHVESLAVPGLDADRCLVWMRPR